MNTADSTDVVHRAPAHGGRDDAASAASRAARATVWFEIALCVGAVSQVADSLLRPDGLAWDVLRAAVLIVCTATFVLWVTTGGARRWLATSPAVVFAATFVLWLLVTALAVAALAVLIWLLA